MTTARERTSSPNPPASPPQTAQDQPKRQHLFTKPLIIGIIVTTLLVIASLFVGVYDVFGAPDGAAMFAITRIPRTMSLVLAGAAMAMSGLVMQQLTQNRFVEPSTTGTTEWAGLGLLASMLLFPEAPLVVKMILAITAAFAGTMVFFLVLRRVTLKSAVIVPIIGLMLSAVIGAISSYVALTTNMLQSMGIWFLGSFTSAIQGQYEPLWAVIIIVVGVFIAADRFTVAGLGEDIATNVGLNYRRVLLIGTGMIAAATGIVTVVIGNLPFLGLIVPNVVSMYRGDNLRSNLPWVCLVGVASVTVADIVGRLIIMPFEVPVGTILAMVGSVVFVYLLVKRRRHV